MKRVRMYGVFLDGGDDPVALFNSHQHADAWRCESPQLSIAPMDVDLGPMTAATNPVPVEPAHKGFDADNRRG